MILGRQRKYHKGQAAIRHYANLREPSFNLRFKLYYVYSCLSPVNTRVCVQGDDQPAGGHGGGGGAAAGEGQAESQGAQDLPQRHGHRRQQRGQGAQHPQV